MKFNSTKIFLPLRGVKVPCKIYFCTGPEQKGTGQTLFLSSMVAGHKDFSAILEAGHILFLVQIYVW